MNLEGCKKASLFPFFLLKHTQEDCSSMEEVGNDAIVPEIYDEIEEKSEFDLNLDYDATMTRQLNFICKLEENIKATMDDDTTDAHETFVTKDLAPATQLYCQ